MRVIMLRNSFASAHNKLEVMRNERRRSGHARSKRFKSLSFGALTDIIPRAMEPPYMTSAQHGIGDKKNYPNLQTNIT